MTARILMHSGAAFLFGLTACASDGWNGEVRNWGTVWQVLGNGDTSGKVRLGDVVRPGTYGLGALEALGGEITVFDGSAWLGRTTGPGNTPQAAIGGADEQAALLALSRVPRWMEHRVDRSVRWEELAEFIEDIIGDAGLAGAVTVPFLVDGALHDLELHVVNGECLHRAALDDSAAAQAPFRRTLDDATGTLVGFITNEPPGVLTHHGSRTHVHVLLASPDPISAHVDRVTLAAGSVVRVPALR